MSAEIIEQKPMTSAVVTDSIQRIGQERGERGRHEIWTSTILPPQRTKPARIRNLIGGMRLVEPVAHAPRRLAVALEKVAVRADLPQAARLA